MQLYTGCVENRLDPLKLGRCQVRVVGLHTHDKIGLKTEDLPWAYPMQSVTSAAMSGIGQAPVGPVEGTWVIIMFRDDDAQYPVMLGTIGGIPQPAGTIDHDAEGITIKADNGTVPSQPSEVVVNNDGEAVTTSAPIPDPVVATVATDIPTTPPPNWKGDRVKASAGIVAILAACDKGGLTTKEQKCSVLAIAGGECGWIPQEEGYSYSATALQATFKSTFGNNPTAAEKYARWKGTRAEFFDYVYAPEHNGKQLGNTQTGDGGKYYGRGFIQLTGRANYAKYGSKAGVDLLTNPSACNTPLDTAASIAVAYVKDRTNSKVSPTDNPGYFYATKKGIGNDTGNGAETRLAYYEWFYGSKTPAGYTEEKGAGSSTLAGSQSSSGAGNSSTGFKDPNNKYPLKSFANEPDTNRLARGISDGTIVKTKESFRAVGIPIALDNGTFDEPNSSFAAKYPYNHVLETESGHIQEFDDTPGNERIHTYHRKGTFTEIDANGTEIHHIVGDSYTIIDRNGCIYIKGECNITADGNINILCQSQANIDVLGDANVRVGNDANIGVAKKVNMTVGDTMDLSVTNGLNIKAGSISIESLSSINIVAATELNATSSTTNLASGTLNESAGNMNVNASNYKETVGESSYRHDGDMHVYIGADTYSRHDSGTDFGCPADPSRSGSDNCSGVDSASSATGASTTNFNLTPPDAAVPLNSVLDYLIAPLSEGEAVFDFESEDDWNTPAGKAAKAAMEKKYGVQNADNTPASDSVTTTSGGINTSVVASCKVIYATETFTSDFKLSEHFTLGMMFDGGFNNKHKLVNQGGLTKQQIVCNLSQLCQNILEKYLEILPGGIDGYGKQWAINSAYRQLSAGIGSSTSDHPMGRAVDLTLLPKDASRKQRNYELVQKMEKLVPYDQIILEYRSGDQAWIHTGYRGVNAGETSGPGAINRKMAFTMLNDATYKKDGKSGFFLL